MKTSVLFIFILVCSSFYYYQETQKFSDSKTVIKNNQYKLDVVQKNLNEEALVSFSLFKKINKKWIKLQDYRFKKQNFFLSVDTSEDLNNDGYKDVKISFAQAARGANEINRLFVFDPKSQKLIDMENSADYPNLHYNEKKDCVTSDIFYGGSATYFLKIKKNKLEPFGKVEFYNDSISSYKIVQGKEILLKKQAYDSDQGATFFSNFDPVEE
ncbi:hypothetical protein SAMN05660477_00567 [Soonwooa buanensis]|uniref:Uncharacterized protein n=1 Tax=Soonwooa buanensis TaxID=619805 RepID=A0A1T5D3I0_9FLAO|nr:hypothetical protein [Soonwooa buanensis]SKB66163.1 hypothetical protein SAMN05660477_00567 [Soonwooa buanensis]